MTLSDLFDACKAEGVSLTPTLHGTLRLGGTKPSDDLRARVIKAKGQVLEALALVDRLDRGWTLCEAANDIDRDRLDIHWIALLHTYQALMDTLLPVSERSGNGYPE